MQLAKLMEGLTYKLRGSALDISGLNYDSRKIQPGDLFIAVRGFESDGHDFVKEAKKKGAAAVLLERWIPDLDLTQILVDDTRRALAEVSANFYDHPAKKLEVWGVTGTNGKTTSTYFLKSILEAAGLRVGTVGTINIALGERLIPSSRTTPESLDLQRILAEMVRGQTDVAVLEVSSHALELHRTGGIPFGAALFTNLTQDHLNFHHSLEQYFSSKLKLFQDLQGPAALNFDDQWGRSIKEHCSGPVISYAIDEPASFGAEKIQLENSGVSYILKSKVGQIPINLRLTGYFNVYNSLGAAALCWGKGIDLPRIKAGLEGLAGVPGRFERIKNERGLNVVVDYAHTPAGLENVLKTARQLVPGGRLIVVFGAGGDRDQSKRPLMGAVAAQLADIVIITSDNPRSEDPQEICSQIETGLLTLASPAHYQIVINRRTAIQTAISLADRGDLVLVAGKGHETYQESAAGRIHFDDADEVRAAIKELKD